MCRLLLLDSCLHALTLAHPLSELAGPEQEREGERRRQLEEECEVRRTAAPHSVNRSSRNRSRSGSKLHCCSLLAVVARLLSYWSRVFLVSSLL